MTCVAKRSDKVFFFLFPISIYIIINLILIKFHEPWRDEALQWLIAEKLSPIEIISEMKYQGHPALWYLLIFPLNRLGFPDYSANLLSLGFMVVGVFIFLMYSPFPIYVRIIGIFSPIFLYFYPVISRSYCLIPSILFLIASTYPNRHTKTFIYGLLIALLIQTHILMLGMAVLLVLFWIIESIRNYLQTQNREMFFSQWKGLFLPLLSFIFLLIQLSGVKSSSWYHPQNNSLINLLNVLYVKINVIFDTIFGIGKNNAWFLLYWFVVFLVITVVVEKKRSIPVSLLIIIGSLFYQFFVYAFVYVESIQKIITCIFILLWGLWVEWDRIQDRIIHWLYSSVIIFLSLMMMAKLNPDIVLDYKNLYSDSRNIANYINRNVPEDSLLITNSDPAASALLPYLDKHTIMNPVTGEKLSYIQWNQDRLRIINDQQLSEWIKTNFPEKREVYLIFLDTIRNENHIDGIEQFIGSNKPIYQTKGITITDEAYDLYKIDVNW
jgi:hypothetical protein